ncbi:MAG: hypothetical protein GEV03_26165 [Streptosporangiales bacterium]|nr:hypothetical protein [Streptosporangiales bacterium]
MSGVTSVTDGRSQAWLERSHWRSWHSVDGTREGSQRGKLDAVLPMPGQTLPPEAKDQAKHVGEVEERRCCRARPPTGQLRAAAPTAH